MAHVHFLKRKKKKREKKEKSLCKSELLKLKASNWFSLKDKNQMPLTYEDQDDTSVAVK